MTDGPATGPSGETPEEQVDLPPEAPELLTDPPEGEPDVAPSPAAADAGADDAPVDEPEAEGAGDAADEVADLRAALADRTHDLQRLQAEYANYRKRVDRDRQLVTENAAYKALIPVIDVLDTIDRAKEHSELDGGFKAVADQLERAVAASGLVRFGDPGDAFDPTLHEALSHLGTDPEATVTTVKHVAKAGFRLGDRVVRAAQVLVVDPAEGSD